ncbi:MFS transporter [Novosphingobium sp. PC22D]|uniref:MFS transporter n=1 Tax=Novosphingobium sp. PC22D TaxID=1962403 RepID=UPI00197D3ACB|nr:MFS transporter [Novosphingobium sp. PC22D]
MAPASPPMNARASDDRGDGTTLAVVSAATALVLVVFTVPLTTLTSTARALAAGPGAQAWILSAMSVGAAIGLLASGAIGDDYGRRRTFVAGAALLAVASVGAALSLSPLMLILCRIVQGIGGAALLSCGLGIIGQAYFGHALTRASGIWAAALGAGVAAGPVLAAGLDGLAGWTAPHWFTGLAAGALALAGRFFLAESAAARPRKVDLAGTILLGTGLAALLGGLTQSRSGWDQPLVYAMLFGGMALLAAFVVVESRIAEPMLDIGLFRRPAFTGATIGALASGAGVLSLMSLIPTLLERAMGVSTIATAFVLIAWSGTTAITAYAVRWLPASSETLLVGGLVGCAIGQVAVFGVAADSSVLRLLPGMILAGAANGVLNASLGRQAVASVPTDRSAMGSGANNTARYVGSATGITICAVLITHAGAKGGVAGLLEGWNHAVLLSAAFSLLGALGIVCCRTSATPCQIEETERLEA